MGVCYSKGEKELDIPDPVLPQMPVDPRLLLVKQLTVRKLSSLPSPSHLTPHSSKLNEPPALSDEQLHTKHKMVTVWEERLKMNRTEDDHRQRMSEMRSSAVRVRARA